jgi:5-formyltetrahydrofolate cyclo-ligase
MNTGIVPINTDKRALRAQLLAQRQALNATEKTSRDVCICRQVYDFISGSPNVIRVVAFYAPIRGEPDLMPLADDLVSARFKVVLPVVVDKNSPLQFAQYTGRESLVKSSMGILEPDLNARVDATELNALVIPCLGFNAQNYRLGYGGGFYDRTLAQLRAQGHKPLTIGVAYQDSECAFEIAAHDEPLDVVLID